MFARWGWSLVTCVLLMLLTVPAAEAGRFTVMWDPNTEANLAGYIVCIGTQSGVYTTIIDVGNVTSHTVTNLPDGRRYYVVIKAYNTEYLVSLPSQEVFVDLPAWTPVGSLASRLFDFNGDRMADVAVYRPATGTWFWLDLQGRLSAVGLGLPGDLAVRGDFDGDGLIDPCVFTPATGAWNVLNSSTNYVTRSVFVWGQLGDVPVTGDYDGDGISDGAVYRRATGAWFIRPSSGVAPWTVTFGGQADDVPMPGDYDGDSMSDLAIYRPATGTWFILTSASGFTQWSYRGWGVQAEGDKPVPGDYDGDGKTDIAVYRPATGTWFILKSSTNGTGWTWYGWGTSLDTPVPADYDGDGMTDAAVYRQSVGTWWILPSSGAAPWSLQFGGTGDVPLLGIQ
jgi:hypothetical protein